jgi:hypothetical protein
MSELLDTSSVTFNADERKRIRDAINEAAGLKQIQKDKADQIKDIVDMLSKTYNLNKRDIRWAITTRFKDNYLEESADFAKREYLYEGIVEPDDNE